MEGLKALAPESTAPERVEPAPTPTEPEQAPAPVPIAPRERLSGPDDPKLDAVMDDWKNQAGVADMEVYRPQMMPSPAMWGQIRQMSEDLALAVSMQPALRRKPADIALLLLVGRDVGVKPSVALNKIHIIDGKPSMSSELMRALIVDRGHDVWFEDVTPTSVTICGHRSNWPTERVARVTWTLEMAMDAELLTAYDPTTGKVTAGKTNWRHHPRSMLKARATSELARDDFPDVLLGISYTPEELGAEVDADGEPLKVPSTAWSENATDAPVYQPAPEIVLAAYQAKVDAMDAETKKALGVKWKELRLRPLKAPGPESNLPADSWMRQVLSVEEIDLAATAIAQVEREAAEDAVTVEEAATAESTGPAPAAQQASPAERVQGLAPSEVTEALEALEDPIVVPDDDEGRRAVLVDVLSRRQMCPTCERLVEGPSARGEVLCGGHQGDE